ncbi:ABC transporter transmembrane domain-containing protein [Ralstonia soli]|uniref:ATP-binding cassette domain-containing protein n=1 Tax=Ralstonia soli TaxID=2953896 RepID=A0ABT1APY2_9RALS|nr:ATP-binding cassette domain-containing protein [Ralstonia soli]MCO5400468.1 ATP-binding cassette domain-containing protein [Ralstonia soli]
MTSASPPPPQVASLQQRIFAALWRAIWRYRKRVLAAVALLVLAKLCAVGVPIVLKWIVDGFGDAARVRVFPAFLLLAYAVLRFGGTLFGELRDMVFSRVSQPTVAAFMAQAFEHLHQLGPRFHASRQTGGLIRDVERGTTGIEFLLGVALFTILPTMVEIGSVLVIMMSRYSGWYLVTILLTFAAYCTATVLLTRRRVRLQRQMNEFDSLAGNRLLDSMLNHEAVKVYTSERFEAQRYRDILRQRIETAVANQRALSLLHVSQSGVIAGGVATVMLLAGQDVTRGVLSVGDLVLINAYIIQVCLPLNALGFMFREAKDAAINAERLFHLLEQRPDVADLPHGAPLHVTQGDVQFDHVDFGYEATRPILHDLSLHVPAGRTVAVVGGSGSGKSTLARLLLRFYDPWAGRVSIDGQDLRVVSQDSVRRAIGIVPQDTILFNDTIAYNIAYGREGATMAEVIEAARAAYVHDFIAALPEGYQTMVGERGLKLSGGEKQRIAIARALLKNPSILIFDEATSALDTRSERAIQRELDRLSAHRTTLVIAHRLSTVVDAHEIVVLEKGRIVERGRHTDLLAAGGVYAQLWTLQRQQSDLEQAQHRLAQQPINLVALVVSVLDGLREAIEARRITVYSVIRSETPSITGDPSRLQGIVGDVLSHAVLSSHTGSRIEIVLERVEGMAQLRVTDTIAVPAVAGAAIPTPPRAPAAMDAMEANSARSNGGLAAAAPAPEPFDVLDPAEPPATLRQEPSPFDTELPDTAQDVVHTPAATLDPLWIRSVVEQHGGRFAVVPLPHGEGTTYVMDFPIRAVAPLAAALGEAASATPQRQPAAADAALAPPDALAGVHVLIVDDQEDAREMLQLLLEAYGANVTAYGAAKPALAALRAAPGNSWPDVLVSDIALGDDEDGYALLRAVRMLESERDMPLDARLPAVALSGYDRPEDRTRALLAGFQLHLAKPTERGELVTAIQSVIRVRRAPAHESHVSASFHSARESP